MRLGLGFVGWLIAGGVMVLASPGRAEVPARPALTAGVGFDRTWLHPGSLTYWSDIQAGAMPWGFIGWRTRADLAVTADVWLDLLDGQRIIDNVWGAAAGIRYAASPRVGLAARVGAEHLSFPTNDSHEESWGAVFAIGVDVELVRGAPGALVVRGTMTASPRVLLAQIDNYTLFSIGLGWQR